MGNGATFNLGNNDVTTSGQVTLANGAIIDGTIQSTVYAYWVQNGTISAVLTGNVGLVMNGSGTVYLTGDNTFTGGTVVESGTLVVENNAALGSGGITVDAGGTLSVAVGITLTIPSGITLSNSGLVLVNGELENYGNLENYATITNNSGASIDDASGATWRNEDNGSQVNNYGSVTSEGTLYIDYYFENYSGGSLNSISAIAVTIDTDGEVDNYGTWTSMSVSNKCVFENYQGATANLYGSYENCGASLMDNFGVVNTSGSYIVNDAGAYWTNENGSTMMVQGLTFVNCGSLTNNGTMTNSASTYLTCTFTGNMVNNGTLYFAQSKGNIVIDGVISGTGSVVIDIASGHGHVQFLDAMTYTGTTTIEKGALWLGNGTTEGSIAAASSIIIDSGAVLDYLEATSHNFGNTISGAGLVANSELGTITLGSHSGFSGTTSGNIVL